jgi:hypothetical protein
LKNGKERVARKQAARKEAQGAREEAQAAGVLIELGSSGDTNTNSSTGVSADPSAADSNVDVEGSTQTKAPNPATAFGPTIVPGPSGGRVGATTVIQPPPGSDPPTASTDAAKKPGVLSSLLNTVLGKQGP